jgi:hypothetical protein
MVCGGWGQAEVLWAVRFCSFFLFLITESDWEAAEISGCRFWTTAIVVRFGLDEVEFVGASLRGLIE